jgi:hypothetical protein
MHLKKYRVDFNAEEFVEFLVDHNTADENTVKAALESFKNTKDYGDDDWDEDFLFDHLVEEGIVLIPISQVKIHKTFNLREL